MSLVRSSNVVYSDLNAYYGQDVSAFYSIVHNEQVINQGLLAILLTRKGTRIFNREFGCSLLDLLFDPIDDIGAVRVQTAISSALKKWEPRIEFEKIIVLADRNNQQYYVELQYTVPSLNGKLVEFTFNLNHANKT